MGRQKIGEGGDRISFLPEGIIHCILSFLPTKYAVGTSVLSTRWRYLWTFVANIDLCDQLLFSDSMNEELVHKTIFMNFVERVLLLNDAPFIHKFCLSSKTVLDKSRINAWISNVLKRKVQVLILNLCVGLEPLVFPHTLFNWESLTIIKLCADSVLKVPASISFSRLKVLHLDDIEVFCDQAIQHVSLSCPILEEVVFLNCRWLKMKVINISAPVLKRLVIVDILERKDSFHDCEIKVYAESLVSLELDCNMAYELSLYNLFSLFNASIDICSTRKIGQRVDKLLKAICDVKDLRLSDDSIEGLGVCELEEDGMTDQATPRDFLSNLKSVEVWEFSGSRNELCFLEFLLKNARALETMTIISSSELLSDPDKQLEVTKQLQMVPKGSMHSVIDIS
ncbi:hypothetical protein IFM89_001036 [Coptis chinensis]|uniref:FBD domain-containing protein n=1 Tax=Coptis chinensis TaxID=261450 RepID=A0A835GW99_9MAGN|nr:hypothetical protein IFM89_001036 [Coptis chinensis]